MREVFTYEAFHVDTDKRTVNFKYQIEHAGSTYNLTETLKFPVDLQESAAQWSSLRSVHLALGISYYKTFLPPVIVQPYRMDEAEAAFWNTILRHGLGEFLYVNHLQPARLAVLAPQDGTSVTAPASAGAKNHRALLGIGGGKDSIVAGELLKQLEIPTTGFVMATGEQLGQTKAVSDAMGVELLVVERTLDSQLFSLQEQEGGYKGHVPISLIFGLVGAVLAVATGSTDIVVANEASASIPRHSSDFGSINHQWSKSFEFERQLQSYLHEHIGAGITYWSAIRPLSSVAVAKLFANYPDYFEAFTSDNFVFRVDPAKRPNARWSLESPKSLSSFILLAPWIDEPELLRIFGRNFLNEPTLEPLFWELTGKEGLPPLDCVGTVEELVLSLNLAAKQGKFQDSRLAQLAVQRGVIHEADWQATLNKILSVQPDHALPADLSQRLHHLFSERLSA